MPGDRPPDAQAVPPRMFSGRGDIPVSNMPPSSLANGRRSETWFPHSDKAAHGTGVWMVRELHRARTVRPTRRVRYNNGAGHGMPLFAQRRA